ncbi:peptidase S53 propeptide [Acetobacter nitrogenifigens DSM 23921 = NBRC 105050]|uniref:Kumamolisin n=1 Tax=Acetobacter nitrogenifigens DSM 23921 = NBRC 105050 TaxID=1120919 RepID=A0A511XC15_9PROT|nr:S53 family peptidase [Acetobacter nitrogenifigens]GBQ88665.1 peptidase S53 propeptide [Acetobacter nitrogenifigens DSM 23921 = NBRC 105050]GEN60462.1 kumamolisin [Acetobacter nitrogenifigens DSM 23921 = NBRC 105050]
MTASKPLPFARSFARPVSATHPDCARVGDVPQDRTIHLTIVLKPSTPIDPTAAPLSREEFAARHGASSDAISRVEAYARAHGMTVDLADAAQHVVRVSGTVKQACAAFRPEKLGLYRFAGRAEPAMAREGSLTLPPELSDDVVAVMGFDERPVARAHFRRLLASGGNATTQGTSMVSAAARSTSSWSPVDVAKHYGFPTDVTGKGQTIGLIELGGGYQASQMAAYFKTLGVGRTGTLTAVSVDRASNAPDNDPSGADGEVQLDIEVAGSVAPGANIAVYFGPNQGSGFFDALNTAVHDKTNAPSVISISWGGPESGWEAQDMDAMDQTMQAAGAMGVTVTVASGDNGASDGTNQTYMVDFPASSPHALGCGGTRLPRSGSEVAWNDGASGGATGGGYSTHFTKPDWQSGNDESYRGVPDVAGNADPETGYQVTVDGTSTVIGGTSAVAPLWAALIALANEKNGHPAGFVNARLYATPTAFNDIVSGDNNGYSAAKGWDPVTGLGSPKGAAIVAAVAPPTT